MVGVDRVSCPYISHNKLKVCVVVFFSFTRNLMFLFSARFFFCQYGCTKSSTKMLLSDTLSTSRSVFQHATGDRFSGHYACIVTSVMDGDSQELCPESCYLIATFRVFLQVSPA